MKKELNYLAHQSFTLQRAISPAFWIATLVLLAGLCPDCL